MTCGGILHLTQINVNHTEANSLMTLFTTRMLDEGFLATSGFNPTWAHQTRHVDDYFNKAESVFGELLESLRKKDINKRINNSPKHSGFSRLVD